MKALVTIGTSFFVQVEAEAGDTAEEVHEKARIVVQEEFERQLNWSSEQVQWTGVITQLEGQVEWVFDDGFELTREVQ